jgi:D-alanyl-D-alanine carboxypeptidase
MTRRAGGAPGCHRDGPLLGMAAGAMVSSTADLAHFYQALLGGRLLDPEQLQAMQTTVDASDQLGHGAGHGLG